jgi:biotin transport system substrate-specific component
MRNGVHDVIPEAVAGKAGFARGPEWARSRTIPAQAALCVVGVAALAVASKVSIPMVPVPITLQTFAVTFLAALFGWRLGGACVVAWLLVGAAGLPVLSGATAGVAKFTGPTAGYLLAFPIATLTIGAMVERGYVGRSLLRLLGVMLIGNAICLAVGAAWLSGTIGAEKALLKGVLPFVVGAALKSALAALSLKLVVPTLGAPREW